MPNRIIKESINESRSLSEISFFSEDLFKRLITYADDYGRFNADYQIILARLYPREIQIVSESDIEDALIELSGAGKIAFYTSTPRKEIYGCFPNWNKHQRVRDSKNKFPEPKDTNVNDWYLRRFVPMKLKQTVIERDGFKCKICGKYISTVQDSRYLIKMGAGLYHIDHIVPVSQGGRATEENLRLTCPQCNLKRKKMFSVDEILEMTLKESENAEILNDSHNVAATCGNSQRVTENFCYNPIQSESNPNPIPPISPQVEKLEEFWLAYPNKKRRVLTEKAYCDLIFSGMVTEEELVASAQNYAKHIEETGDKMYLPNNFLEKHVFEDFLSGTNQEQETESVDVAEEPEEELIGDDWIDVETPWGR